MDFKICTIRTPAEMESLPVAKIVDYPLEKRDYRPFAQAIICRDEQNIFLRLWAFEVLPPDGSALWAVLYPFADRPRCSLRVCLTAGGEKPDLRVFLAEGNSEEAVDNVAFRSWCGEDLQGVYWGGQVAVPFVALGAAPWVSGSVFPGNFYKICAAESRRHCGSFFPADWDDAFAPVSMGQLCVVDY